MMKPEEFQQQYASSLENNHSYWLEQAKRLDWDIFPTQSLEYVWDGSNDVVEHKWFADGYLNVAYNCLDRHVNSNRATKLALIWQGQDDTQIRKISYLQLHRMVGRCANALLRKGIKKGDRVCIYLPMIPEAIVAMLACARIGAIHCVVFAGFSSESLASRIKDSGAKLLITADESFRGKKMIPLKDMADLALKDCSEVKHVMIVKLGLGKSTLFRPRDSWWHHEMEDISHVHQAEPMQALEPLFILYTSGSTGKPKGLVHGMGGYLLHASLTYQTVFDYQENDIYWCTADIGWVTGHSYLVYGPLSNGATIFMYEGIPTYPNPGRFWELIDKYKISVFYTAPTLIRSLMREGNQWIEKYSLNSLRLLGSVGEPINAEAWNWYHQIIGKGQCPIVDTWWQTETGGILISPIPGVHPQKPGCANHPFYGVDPIILNESGETCKIDESGRLFIKRPWPGIAQTLWGDHQRFIQTYFSMHPLYYFTGDACKKDADGDYWLEGRIDDVMNVSGHRLGTAEIESALDAHESVSEAAVVPMPHDIKGQGIYAFVVLYEGQIPSETLINELQQKVSEQIGPIAKPDVIKIVPQLPKTRSGKIMRRILRKLVEGERENLGDLSTLAELLIIKEIVDLL